MCSEYRGALWPFPLCSLDVGGRGEADSSPTWNMDRDLINFHAHARLYLASIVV